MAETQLKPKNISLYKSKPIHKKICKLYQDNTPIMRISKLTGTSRAAIIRHLKAANIYIYKDIKSKDIYNNKDININKEEIKDIEHNTQSVISSKVDLNYHNSSNEIDLTNIEINKMDNIIMRLLKMLDRKAELSDLSAQQKVKSVDLLTQSKTRLKDSTNPRLEGSNLIINFIKNLNFKEQLKDMDSVKSIDIDVKAIE